MKRCGSAGGGNDVSKSKLLVTVVGVANVCNRGREKPTSLHLEVEAGGVTQTTVPARPVQQAAAHTLSASFEQTLEFPQSRAGSPVTLTLHATGCDRALGKGTFDPTKSGSGKKQWVALKGVVGGDAHIQWSFGATAPAPHAGIARPQTAVRKRGDAAGSHADGLDSFQDPVREGAGPGTLHLHVADLRCDHMASPPASIAVVVTYAGSERSSSAHPVEAKVKLDLHAEFDLVYSESAKFVQFAAWARGAAQESSGNRYEDTLLGSAKWYLAGADQTAPLSVTLQPAGFDVSFSYRLSYQRPLQEGSSGRPKSAYPKKLKNAAVFDVEQAVQSMNGETHDLLEKADRSLSADEVEMDFDKGCDSSNMASLSPESPPCLNAADTNQMAAMLQGIQQQLVAMNTLFSKKLGNLDDRVARLEGRVDGLCNSSVPDSPPSLCHMSRATSPVDPASIALRTDVSGVLVTEDQLRSKFRELDAKNRGFITRDALKQFYHCFDYGLDVPDVQVDRVISRYTATDHVPYNEFAQLALSLAKR